ncbi:MAG TPA: hypothetical protein VN923_08690, partial [Thermoanaerobaculia bacterium]|nr:hypothetical protein [Thermoanaerobaculia bacterium]
MLAPPPRCVRLEGWERPRVRARDRRIASSQSGIVAVRRGLRAGGMPSRGRADSTLVMNRFFYLRLLRASLVLGA